MELKIKLEVSALLVVLTGFILFFNQTISKSTFFWIAVFALLYFAPYLFFKNFIQNSLKERIFLNLLITSTIILCYIPLHIGITKIMLYLIVTIKFILVYLLFIYAKNISDKGTEFILGSICILLLTSVLAVYL